MIEFSVTSNTESWICDILVVLSSNEKKLWTARQLENFSKIKEIWIFGVHAWALHDDLDDSLLLSRRDASCELPITNAISNISDQEDILEEILERVNESILILYDFSSRDLAESLLKINV